MVQAAEDRAGDDISIRRHDVPLGEYRRRIHLARFGHSWPEAHVRARSVVVRGPFADDTAEMALGERDDPVEALTAHGANQAFAERIRFRCVGWCAEKVLHSRNRQIFGSSGWVSGERSPVVARTSRFSMSESEAKSLRMCLAAAVIAEIGSEGGRKFRRPRGVVEERLHRGDVGGIRSRGRRDVYTLVDTKARRCESCPAGTP